MRELRGGSSGSSDESERGVKDLLGESCFWPARDARSVRADETEDEEVLCAVVTPEGWVVRARDERRGDIGGVAFGVSVEES